MSETTRPVCPLCGKEAAEVSRQLAPAQVYCNNSDCPICTWDKEKSYDEA